MIVELLEIKQKGGPRNDHGKHPVGLRKGRDLAEQIESHQFLAPQGVTDPQAHSHQEAVDDHREILGDFLFAVHSTGCLNKNLNLL